MDFIKTILLSLSVMASALWVGAIIQAKDDEKLEVACKPVSIAIDKIQVIATGLIGYVPKWTYSAKRVLEGGCYYFFSTFLFSSEDDLNSNNSGGVHQ